MEAHRSPSRSLICDINACIIPDTLGTGIALYFFSGDCQYG